MNQLKYNSLKPINSVKVGDIYLLKESRFDSKHKYVGTFFRRVEVIGLHSELEPDLFILKVIESSAHAQNIRIERNRKYLLKNARMCTNQNNGLQDLYVGDTLNMQGKTYKVGGLSDDGKMVKLSNEDGESEHNVEDLMVSATQVSKAENTEAGGFLVGKKDGKLIMHNDGNLGGYLVGRRHSTGGIDGVNANTGQAIEVETEELVITKDAVNSQEKKSFNGKDMTNKEILSSLNQDGGGVAFAEGGAVDNNAGKPLVYQGGEAILTRGAVSNPKKYEYDGKMMTTREIASDINVKAGGVAFAEGGDIPEKVKCGCMSLKVGGSTYTPEDFFTLSEKEYQEKRLIDGIEKERRDHFYTLAKLNSGAISVEQALREIAATEMMLEPSYPY